MLEFVVCWWFEATLSALTYHESRKLSVLGFESTNNSECSENSDSELSKAHRQRHIATRMYTNLMHPQMGNRAEQIIEPAASYQYPGRQTYGQLHWPTGGQPTKHSTHSISTLHRHDQSAKTNPTLQRPNQSPINRYQREQCRATISSILPSQLRPVAIQRVPCKLCMWHSL